MRKRNKMTVIHYIHVHELYYAICMYNVLVYVYVHCNREKIASYMYSMCIMYMQSYSLTT